MYQVEKRDLFIEARHKVTISRKELIPYFDVVNESLGENKDIGIFSLKTQLLIDTEYQDLVFELRSKTIEQDMISLAKKLGAVESSKKVIFTSTNDPQGYGEIHLGRYLLVRFRYGEWSLGEKLTYVYDGLLAGKDWWDVEEKLVQTLETGWLKKNPYQDALEKWSKDKDCLLIKGTNIFITKSKSFITEVEEYSGSTETKNYGPKYLIKNLTKKTMLVVFLTALKTTYPSLPSDDHLAHPLAALYHIASSGLNDVVLGFIHEARKKMKEPFGPLYGNLDYVDRRKMVYEVYTSLNE